MATLGFEQVMIGIMDKDENVTKVHTIDAKNGGTIEGKIGGLAPSMNVTYASNVPFFVSAVGTGQPQLDLDVADLPDEVVADITGATVENGITKIGATTVAPYVAVILKAKGASGDDVFVSLLKGKFGHPDLDLKTGDDKGQELSTDSLSGQFIAREDGLVYAKGRTGAADFTFEEFKAFVFPGYTDTTTTGA